MTTATVPGGSTYTGSLSADRYAAISASHRLLEAVGITRSPGWVARTVGRFDRARDGDTRTGSLFAWLVAAAGIEAQQATAARDHPDYHQVISYRDPVGEAAVANVMRKRGRR